ncbi:MAG TPA: ribosome maturation factor RimM [Candidatus Gastranaerophilaceae bacterium]|nr:ribosome maturation factor RimM [Candidatus Gastranaerophilaceae bacterium]
MDKYVSVGKILNFHGIQGEAKVGFSKNQADFLKSLKSAFIKFENEYKLFKISSVRFNKNFALIKFQGINSINELIPYKNCLIFVERQTAREKLEENEFLIDELTGLDVFDQNNENIGIAVGVSNNGINDFISVKSKSKNICLVPFVKALVPEVDIKNKKIIVNNIKGLIE